MNKEEIKNMIKTCIYSEDGITYMSDKQYNNYMSAIDELQKKINKAIKFIEKGSYKDLYNIKSIDTLLEILRGDNNE